MRGSSRAVVHIGIDAANFALLDGMAARGLMPTYAALKRRAGHSVLLSTVPWFTVPGWISLMTGVPATRHGCVYWTTSRPADYWRETRSDRLMSSADIPYPTIFELASAAGLRVGSLNMPVTHPPIPVNGVMVSGFLGPTDPSRAAHPPGFLDAYPDYEIDVEAEPAPRVERMSESVTLRYASRLASMAGARARVARDLIRQGFDLVSVVFVGPDRLLHVAWPVVDAVLGARGSGRGQDADRPTAAAMAAVADYYRALDEALGMILDEAGDGLVMITSDHGQGPPPSRLLAVNSWLRELGLLVGGASSARRLARLVPAGARRRLWAALRARRPRPLHAPPFIDWGRTMAHGVRFSHCSLFGVALRERSPALIDEVTAALGSIRDPATYRPVVTEVLRGDRLAQGPATGALPDLLAVMGRGWGTVAGLDGGPAIRSNRESPSGDHEIEGLLLAAGPGIEAGPRKPSAIWEVAPTVLAALGIPRPEHMDTGPIPWIVSEPDATGRRSGAGVGEETPVEGTEDADRGEPDRGAPQPALGLTERETEAVTRHLQELGYLD